jgi:peptidoglycan/LPS O-acetylase OafA/YrhL
MPPRPVVSQQTAGKPREAVRLYYLDWLRVLAILTVFVYHSTRFFNLEDWHVKNPTWYPEVEVWNVFAITWMMPLIFVISGASLFYAVGKGGGGIKAAGKFVKDKTLRLLVPLLVGVFTHASLQVYLERLTHGQFSGTYFQFLPQYFQGFYEGGNPASGNFALTGMHLWYLFWLFLFSLMLYPLLHWLKGGGRRVLSRLGAWLALPGAVYAMALPILLLLIFVDPADPVAAKKEAGWYLLIYLWLLLSGFVIVSHDGVQGSVRRLRWLSLALAVVSIGAFLFLVFQSASSTFGTPHYALVAGLRSLSSWCCVLAILGMGMQRLNFSIPLLGYANEAVLPFYILHQTVLLCVGYFVVQWAIPDLLKWVIILVASFTIIMGLYEFLIRRFNVMRFLFGLKPLTQQPAARSREAFLPR